MMCEVCATRRSRKLFAKPPETRLKAKQSKPTIQKTVNTVLY